jgi:hypothetical protein
MMKKVFRIILRFRTGDELGLKGESVVINKGPKTFYNQLFLNGIPIATLEKGSPNFDSNNNYKLYNASPTKALYDMMPDSWDKTRTSLKIIDEIYVITQKQPAGDQEAQDED